MQSNSPQFAVMTQAMLPEILIIENQSYAVGWSVQLFKDCLNKNYQCTVMTIEQQIIGYSIIQIILDEYHILNLCVSPDFQGRGLGKYQLQSIMELAQTANMNRILLEVRASNKIARKMYSRSGFQIIGKRKNYYPQPVDYCSNEASDVLNKREDAHVMELALA